MADVFDVARDVFDHPCELTCSRRGETESALASFQPQEMSEFFRHALPDALRQQVARNGDCFDELLDRVRVHCGIWYGTLFLAGLFDVNPHDDRPVHQRRSSALAREGLAWMPEAFLANVVVYFRDGRSEDIHMVTALRVTTDKSVEALERFHRLFDDYLREYGTTVRTDIHFARPRRASNARARLQMGVQTLEYFETVTLPSEAGKNGDPKVFLSKAQEAFGALFPGTKVSTQPYCIIQESAGWDTGNPDGGKSVGAVAHMFVLLEGNRYDKPADSSGLFVHDADNDEYRSAMRHSLSRLATTYALTVMRDNQIALEHQETLERRRSAMMNQRIVELDKSIRNVEDTARGVRALLLENTWDLVDAWFPALDDLFASPPRTVWICGAPIQSVHAEGSWTVDHVAAAMLALIGAQDVNITRGMTHSVKWAFYSTVMFEAEKAIRPIWRSLSRNGTLARRIGVAGANTEDTRDDVETLARVLKQIVRRKQDDRRCVPVPLVGYAVGVTIDPVNSTRVVHFAPGFDVRVAMFGLHSFLNELLIPSHKETAQVDAFFSDPAKESWSMRLSPLMVDLNATHIIRPPGFRELVRTIAAIQKTADWPGYSKRTTSVAALAALGVHEINWSALRNELYCDPEANEPSVCRITETGEVARLFHSGDALWIRYYM